MSTSKPNELERSLNRQVILDEDEYTAALSHIIARDFFPSLVHLEATNEYLDAVQTRDPQLIAASVRGLERAASTPLPSSSGWRRGVHPSQTPSQTPYAAFPSDTPRLYDEVGEGEEGGANKRPRYDTGMSLDEFQAHYTSEDNSSFTQIMDEENKKRKERYGWAWETQRRVEEQRERMLEAREKMLIEPASTAPGVREKLRIELRKPVGLITDGGEQEKGKEKEKEKEKEEKAMVLKATSVEEATQAVMAPKKDARPAGVDGWKFKARNSLMFAPDADTSPYHPPPTKSAASAETKAAPKVISHDSTRLQEQEFTKSSGLSEPPSPTRSRIEAAISGTPYRPRSPSLSDVNSLVPNVPNPTPEQLGPIAMKQLMTWGTLNATPRILSTPDDEDIVPIPSTPFHIRAMSSREALSHRLANSASKSLRVKAEIMGLRTPGVLRTPKGKGKMGPPTWTPRRAEAAGSLTPAARRLLERSTLGTAAAKRAEEKAQERDLNRVRWTPTPAPGRSTG